MPDWLKDWWPVLALGLSVFSPLLIGWIGWSLSRKFATREDIGAIREAIAGEAAARCRQIEAEAAGRRWPTIGPPKASSATPRSTWCFPPAAA